MLKLNSKVKIRLPGGIKTGIVFKILKGYKQLTKEDCYEIHGNGFVSISSARMLMKIKEI